MNHPEPNAVLRYFEPTDGFVRLRVFTAPEIAGLFEHAHLPNRRAYVDLVVNACVVDLAGTVLARSAEDRAVIADRLFELCVEANPGLDLRKIAIPVKDEPAPTLHLLRHVPADAPRTFSSLRGLEQDLADRVVGQPEAVGAVARALRKALTGLRDPQRPIATFFFVGQTGVGKTELAKAVTFRLTGDPGRMVRVDCSEYALPHEYAKLIGAPPGYIGHDHGGLLAGLLGRGRSIVLFDEIEKSDGKVHDLLLQAMDEGFVTDNKGARIPFGEVVLILTSNVGAQEMEALRNRMGFDSGRRSISREQVAEETLSGLKVRFRPEFVNRLSEVVLFNAIGLEDCVRIVRRLLDGVRGHAANVPIEVEFADGVAPFLAEKGFKPEYGARELRRTVERDVEGPLSDLLVEGRLNLGDRVRVRVRHDRLDFLRN